MPTSKATDKPTELRPYQKGAVEACLKALDEGMTRIGVSAPTGSGKTLIFVSLIEEFIKSSTDKVLIVVGNDETRRQAFDQAKWRFKGMGGFEVGLEQGQSEAHEVDNV
jgi:ATP-dependent helicase IRC3